MAWAELEGRVGGSGALLSALHVPVCSRYAMLTSSTGKKAAVAPYSGHMLAIVARSAMDSCATPGPKNSTNLPTTPTCRRCYTAETIGKSEGWKSTSITQSYLLAVPSKRTGFQEGEGTSPGMGEAVAAPRRLV